MSDVSNDTVVAYTAIVVTGGSAYSNGDTVALSGGSGTAPTYSVTASGGVVTQLVLNTPGNLTSFPTNPASFSGGSGTGLTANVYIASSSRSLAARSSDDTNVKDFGAALNGITPDDVAFQTARNAVHNYGTIKVPNGSLYIASTWPTPPSGTVALWKMTGNYSNYSFSGTDIFESFDGSKWFFRTGTVGNDPPVVRIDDNITTSAGSTGTVVPTLKLNTNIPANSYNNYYWGLSSVLNSSATGPGQHVAVAGYANKLANGSELWGANFLVSDQTGNGSTSSGAIVGVEIDLSGNGTDTGGAGNTFIPANQGIRIGLQLATSQYNSSGSAASFGYGILIGTGLNTSFQRGICLAGDYSLAAITTEYAVISGNNVAYKMAAGQNIAFDGNDLYTMTYNSSSSSWQLIGNGITVHSFNSTGGYSTPGGLAGVSVRATPATSGIGFAVLGTTGSVGFDTESATLAGPAFRMASGQYFALESTGTLTLGSDSSSNVNIKTGTNTNLQIANNGNITMRSGATLQIGSAYISGAPTVTGYIQITDSSGIVRHLACS